MFALNDSLSFFSNNTSILQSQLVFDSHVKTLRFHEAFRNRSLNVRAESNFLQSYFLTKINGYKGSENNLRRVLLSNVEPDDLYHDLFLRLCSANNFISTLMPDLQRNLNTRKTTNFSMKYLLPKLHSTISINKKVGIPRSDESPLSFHISPVLYSNDILERIDLITSLFSNNSHAHICAAILFAEIVLTSPFVDSNFELAVIISRLYLCKSGVDPTGCVIFTDSFSPLNSDFIKNLKLYSTGEIENIELWIQYFLNNLISNFSYLTDMADSVLAKVIRNWD